MIHSRISSNGRASVFHTEYDRFDPGYPLQISKGELLVRNRRKTIESLRRLAERPGTAAEGATALLLLERNGRECTPAKTLYRSGVPEIHEDLLQLLGLRSE